MAKWAEVEKAWGRACSLCVVTPCDPEQMLVSPPEYIALQVISESPKKR